jgi:hypothetical protein
MHLQPNHEFNDFATLAEALKGPRIFCLPALNVNETNKLLGDYDILA